MIRLMLQDAAGVIVQDVQGDCAASVTYERTYAPGDTIVLESDQPWVYASVDAFLQPAWLYIPEGRLTWPVPTAQDLLLAYHPLAFRPGIHTLFAAAAGEAPAIRRDLALNPMAQRRFAGAYPFASANVETRDEPVFFARNVVDGLLTNTNHGFWPWESWGIGLSETAELTIDFGRPVTIDSFALTLRADFPHDAYWKQAAVTLSDGFTLTFPLEMTGAPQLITLPEKHTVTSVRLHSLVKQVMDSPFPALRAWQVFGIG